MCTLTFPDGLDKHITPRLVRHRQSTTRLPEEGIANRMDAGPRAASIYCPYKLTAERAATFFPGLSWGQNGANALDELVHPVPLQAACLV